MVVLGQRRKSVAINIKKDKLSFSVTIYRFMSTVKLVDQLKWKRIKHLAA